MSLRFRQSVRLFPGVRLNISGGGISTTVGVRGASVTFGQRGSYLNLGLPGTGVSYRTKIAPGSGPRRRSESAVGYAEVVTPPETHEIRSDDVGELTSPGLDELKRLINECAARRATLAALVASLREDVRQSRRRLDLANAFLIRLFAVPWAPDLKAAVAAATLRLREEESDLEACCIDVDFGFHRSGLDSYESLVRTFEQVRSCRAIWDITATTEINRPAERTTATRSFTRTPVRFELIAPDLVRTSHPILRLADASSRDLCLYPGFLMMRDVGGDFALIEYRDVVATFGLSRFIEDEAVPDDTVIVGRTWLRANQDGSQDMRFRENVPLPIVRYGKLQLGSPEGLAEAYMFSDAEKARAFAEALENHQSALSDIASNEGALGSLPAVTDASDRDAEPPDDPGFVSETGQLRPTNYALDWLAFGGLVFALAFTGVWVVDQAKTPSRPTAQVIVAPPQPLTLEEVRRALGPVQKALTARGFKPGTADGVMGPRTRGALKAYQTTVGLVPTGEIDRATLQRLGLTTDAFAQP